jgi:hypothetical protein
MHACAFGELKAAIVPQVNVDFKLRDVKICLDAEDLRCYGTYTGFVANQIYGDNKLREGDVLRWPAEY